jgi:hypothetical protein
VRHRTGPRVPVALRVLAVQPILLFAVGGLIGGLVRALGLVVNLVVARTSIPSAVKALIMIGVGVVASVVWLAIAVAVQGGISQG